MSKLARKSDREETEPKPRRKRRKKDFDSVHAKILKAKSKLDNVRRNNNKGEHRRCGVAKISSRLLPRPAAGIYRNGAKGKNVEKTERPENTYVKARLEGDALKLFNGDTLESKYIVEDMKCDDATKRLSNKESMRNNLEWTPCTLEQSPILRRRQSRNQKLCSVKKKDEENFFKNLDSSNIKKQDIIKESKCTIQKEDICKRRLFQNEKEQMENNNATQIQIFDDNDFPKTDQLDKKARQIFSENSKDAFWDPLNLYMKHCAKISAEIFQVDFLQNRESDPLTATIKKLRQIYADSYHQLRSHDKSKRELLNEELHTLSEEYQACTYSHDSQSLSIEFEIPRCSENQIVATHLQENITQKNDKLQSNFVQNCESKRSGNAIQYGPTSYLSQNAAAVYGTNSIREEDYENSDEQYMKQPSIHQSSTRLYFVNEKNRAHLNSQKNPSFVRHSSRNNHHVNQRVNNFCIDTPNNAQCFEKTKYLQAPIFSYSSLLPPEKNLSKICLREKLSTKLVKEPSSTVSDEYATNNALQRYNDRKSNKCNIKDIRRIPTILRRCNNITINKNSQHAQINRDCTDLYKKSEINLFNKSLNNSVTKECYKTEFSNMFEDFAASTVVDVSTDRSKILESHIGSMKLKDSQESKIEKYDINLCPNKLNEKNEFWQFDKFSEPTMSHNTNAYIEKLTQQHEVASHIKDHHFHSNNNHPINHLQSTSFSNLSIKPVKQFFQRTNSQNDLCRYMCNTRDTLQELTTKSTHNQRQNIFLDSVESRTMPTTTLNHPQNNRINKKPELFTCEEMIDKTNIEYIKEHTNPNMRNRNERYICFDSCNCSRNCDVSHAYHSGEDTVLTMAEPEILCSAKDYNSSIDKCVNLLNGMQNVQSLPLEYKRVSYTYPKVVNSHHRAMLLQDVTQPIKYLAVKNGPNIQKIPVYMNADNAEIAENVPLKLMTIMNTNNPTNSFPRAITTTQVMPLQTSTYRFNDLMYNKCNHPFAKHENSVNAILFDSNLQPNTSRY